uniref:Uncharacterized protein n=1 Tax=Rhizophora mucronata TaxID=61149 RepID=A0A2P2NKW5_RHIMU
MITNETETETLITVT